MVIERLSRCNSIIQFFDTLRIIRFLKALKIGLWYNYDLLIRTQIVYHRTILNLENMMNLDPICNVIHGLKEYFFVTKYVSHRSQIGPSALLIGIATLALFPTLAWALQEKPTIWNISLISGVS